MGRRPSQRSEGPTDRGRRRHFRLRSGAHPGRRRRQLDDPARRSDPPRHPLRRSLGKVARRGRRLTRHVPHAQNIPWAQAANEDGTFKSPDELRQLYANKGVTGQNVIAYCRIGERSSHTWFVLKELLGFNNVKNYDGSWTEYGSVIGVPIENPATERQPASV